MSHGGQDAQGDGEIETSRLLGQIGRSEIDRDALVERKLQPTVAQSCSHPFAGLFHFGVRQPHQGERRQAVGEMDFDGDLRRFEAIQGTTVNDGK